MNESKSIDRKDRVILKVLQKDARTTLSEIAKQVHLSTSQVQRRVRRLEETGVVEGYSARISPAAMGYEVGAFIEISLRQQDTDSADGFHEAVRQIPQILECHRVSGDSDYLLRVVAESLESYSHLAQRTIKAIQEVDRLKSLIIFESPKDTTDMPL